MELATATEIAGKSFDPSIPLPVTQSLLASLVGILVVFLGLCILIVLILLLGKATANLGKKKEAPKPAAPAPAAPVAEEVVEEDDAAVVAAIMAAITCMMAGENKGFVVKHVRRINNAPSWQKAGRERTIANRF